MILENKKIFACISLFALTCTVLTGCGKSPFEDENIELLEPVGASAAYFETEYRNIYEYEVFSSTVAPAIKEYAFESNQTFDEFSKLPGDQVKKGDIIAKSSTEKLDEEIKKMKEKLDKAEEDYTETIVDLNKSLSEKKSDYEYYSQIVENMDRITAENPNYVFSQFERSIPHLAQATDLTIQRINESILETTKYYELDHAYETSLYKKKQDEKREASIIAEEDGVIAAIDPMMYKGEQALKDSPVTSVVDTGKKLIATEFIGKSKITKANDYFAVVNGKRYEVEYEAIESEEYSRLLAENDVVYSHFYIVDPANEVNVGDFAVLVIIKNSVTNTLAVPVEAVSRDEAGNFVYIYDESGDKVYTPVKTGIKDAKYIEILSGLKEGDRVVTDYKLIVKGTDTLKLTKGTISKDYSENGYLYYSEVEWLTNPAEYGTVYIDELCVSRYERVEKGQPIAKLRVDVDAIDIARKERELLRANEALDELVKNNDEKGSNDKAIAAKNKQIADITKTLNKMKSDDAITEFVAPYSGIVTGYYDFEAGDILKKDARIVQFSREDSCFIVIEDKNNQLSFGNDVVVSYKNAKNENKDVPGFVTSMTSRMLSKKLKSDYAIVKIPSEYIADMAGSSQGYEGWWNRSRFTITSDIRKMENVILIPRKAVTDVNGNTYVKVKKPDGGVTLVSFICGGSDNSNYWVISGLEEGMEICLE